MKAVFFDRDGVVNKDFGYVYKSEEFTFLENIFELLKFCHEKGFLILLVTNQSGIGRGYYTLEDFKELTKYMQDRLKQHLGFGFEGIYYCPHDPQEDCLCRKPKPGMIEEARKDFNLNLKECFIIGDKISDMLAGNSAGIKNKIFLNKTGEKMEDIDNIYYATSLKQVLKIMEEILGK